MFPCVLVLKNLSLSPVADVMRVLVLISPHSALSTLQIKDIVLETPIKLVAACGLSKLKLPKVTFNPG